ncbi:LytR/AlgR family response regulator transcription factor [Anaerorhabdus sp.]|uniref:LytR/AlgR family response regulator transcription factor n=1 Tax=Anaerorhabdus sp. TaxID=1872524 RepID=UPI002FC6D725
MKIALVEDNKEYSTLLINEIMNRNIGVDIEYFEDGESFLQSTLGFDFAILDIELPGIDGIKISKSMKTIDTRIVFLTSITDRVFEAFGEKVLGYLLKGNDIKKTINELIDFINQIEKLESIHLITEFGEIDIELKNILRVAKENRKVYLTTDKNKVQIYQNTLSNMHDKTNGYLVYINKSTMINIFRMISFTDNAILLENGIVDTISRDYLHSFKKEYLKRVAI